MSWFSGDFVANYAKPVCGTTLAIVSVIMKPTIRKVRLDRGGYAPDHGHKYFGVSLGAGDVYEYNDPSDDGASFFVRARTRKEALVAIASKLGEIYGRKAY